MSVIDSSDMFCSEHVDVLLTNAAAQRRTTSALNPQQLAARCAASTTLQFHVEIAVVMIVSAIVFHVMHFSAHRSALCLQWCYSQPCLPAVAQALALHLTDLYSCISWLLLA